MKRVRYFEVDNEYYHKKMNTNEFFKTLNSEVGTAARGERKGGIFLFNESDETITQFLLMFEGIKELSNPAIFADVSYRYSSRLVRYACGKYTRWHPTMANLTRLSPKKIVMPNEVSRNMAGWYTIYDLYICRVTHEDFMSGDPTKLRSEHFENVKVNILKDFSGRIEYNYEEEEEDDEFWG